MTNTIDMNVVQELLDLCDDGDTSLITELIDMFLADGPTRVATIVAAAANSDLESVEQAAHSLKGASGNLGATTLMNITEEMQVASRSGQLDEVKHLVPLLEAQFAAAEDALRNLHAQYSPA